MCSTTVRSPTRAVGQPALTAPIAPPVPPRPSPAAPPVVRELSVAVAAPGASLSLRGSGLFRPPAESAAYAALRLPAGVRVRFAPLMAATASAAGPGADAPADFTDVEGEVDEAGSSVTCTMPPLPWISGNQVTVAVTLDGSSFFPSPGLTLKYKAK